MNFITKINLFMILLFIIAKVYNGEALYELENQSNLSQPYNRAVRHARILDIRMRCAPGMTYIEGRCRKLV